MKASSDYLPQWISLKSLVPSSVGLSVCVCVSVCLFPFLRAFVCGLWAALLMLPFSGTRTM